VLDNDRVSIGAEGRLGKAELSSEVCLYACVKGAVSFQLGLGLQLRFEEGKVTAEIAAAIIGAKLSVGLEQKTWDALTKALEGSRAPKPPRVYDAITR